MREDFWEEVSLEPWLGEFRYGECWGGYPKLEQTHESMGGWEWCKRTKAAKSNVGWGRQHGWGGFRLQGHCTDLKENVLYWWEQGKRLCFPFENNVAPGDHGGGFLNSLKSPTGSAICPMEPLPAKLAGLRGDFRTRRLISQTKISAMIFTILFWTYYRSLCWCSYLHASSSAGAHTKHVLHCLKLK